MSSATRAGAVLGFGLGGLVDGIVLHQVLQWHHLVAANVPTTTLRGLERNTFADGLFHVATTLVVVAGVLLLWRAPRDDRRALGGALAGFGAFHVVDELVFHLLLGLHHIRMVENYAIYDAAFAGIGVVLLVAGWAVLRGASRPLRRAPAR